MEKDQEFLESLKGKKIPLLVLDSKWHRLFAVHGKPDSVSDLEKKESELLKSQAKIKEELKEVKKLKEKLLSGIVKNMDKANDDTNTLSVKKQEESKKLVDEANEKIEELEDELLNIPYELKETNEKLMLLSMEYFYEKLRVNKQESNEISDWIKNIRIELKRNIIKKQNRDINNKEIYSYLHDIFGMEILDIFDIKYDSMEETDADKNKENS